MKFKKGDKVKITGKCNDCLDSFYKGDVVEIMRVFEDGTYLASSEDESVTSYVCNRGIIKFGCKKTKALK